MAVVYFVYYAAFGALIPFLSVYYRSLGLSGSQISMLMSISPVLLFLAQPIFSPMADRSGHRGRLLGRMLTAAAVTALLIPLAHGFWTLLPLVALWAFIAGPVTPLADSIALGEAIATGVSFPRIRLWGSVGFLVLTTIVGRLFNVISLSWAFVIYGGLMLAAVPATRRLPAEGVAGQRPVFGQMLIALKNPQLRLFLLCSGVLTLSLAADSAFYSIHFMGVGGTSGQLGVAWALCALTEVPVWLILGRVMDRTGPAPLLTVGALLYAVRFWLTGAVTAPGALLALQPMQAVTFALYLPSSIVFMAHLIPGTLRTSGQALLSLVNGGIATVVGTLAAGRVLDRWGSAVLYQTSGVVAGVAGVGFLLMVLTRSGRKEESHG